MTIKLHCTHCGSEDLERGFIFTRAQGTSGVGRWYSGLFETGLFGIKGADKRRQGAVDTFRCTACSHLEQFADLRRW